MNISIIIVIKQTKNVKLIFSVQCLELGLDNVPLTNGKFLKINERFCLPRAKPVNLNF